MRLEQQQKQSAQELAARQDELVRAAAQLEAKADAKVELLASQQQQLAAGTGAVPTEQSASLGSQSNQFLAALERQQAARACLQHGLP